MDHDQESYFEIYIAFQNEFFQGDLTEHKCIGVFSSPVLAEEFIYDLQQDEIFDPMFRIAYEIVPAVLDQPLGLEEE